MAKNQRQRRPLQDEGRTEKKTARERAQASRRQRDRIEENRDRREQRRERNRLRRQTVDSVRSPKEDVRMDRFDSRLVPIEDTFLGRPVGSPTDLPVVIGERWYRSTDQTISNNSETTLAFDAPTFVTERNGYPSLYQGSSTGVWRVPAGLSGIWLLQVHLLWNCDGAGNIDLAIEYTDDTRIGKDHLETPSVGDYTQQISIVHQFSEGDEFKARVLQVTGTNLFLTGGANDSLMSAVFLGK
jgi:hypothetical protein